MRLFCWKRDWDGRTLGRRDWLYDLGNVRRTVKKDSTSTSHSFSCGGFCPRSSTPVPESTRPVSHGSDSSPRLRGPVLRNGKSLETYRLKFFRVSGSFLNCTLPRTSNIYNHSTSYPVEIVKGSTCQNLFTELERHWCNSIDVLFHILPGWSSPRYFLTQIQTQHY